MFAHCYAPSINCLYAACFFPIPLAFDELPDGEQIPHVQQLDDDLISLLRVRVLIQEVAPTSTEQQRHPPDPLKLVKRVEEGLFVEMAELHPNYLESVDFNSGDQPTGSHKRPPEVFNIVDWIQCFGIYMAIISRSKPKRIADLIGYQSLIIGASQLCHESQWILYDHRFPLKASATRTKQWSVIDITIWNTTFPDRAIRRHQAQGLNIHPTPLNHSQRSLRQNQPPPTKK